jgi:hypothetical protein
MYARKDASKVEVNIILGTRLKFTLHRSSDFGLLSSMKKNMGLLAKKRITT